MAYKIKSKKTKAKEESYKIEKYKAIAEDLDDEAYLMYNTKFNDLSDKEKREVTKKYIE
ncbi:MAG TPA: hypothetical protein VMZ91_13490 [Candidatus Paceibacterota bacterium]|nr:hypothetical protein [Candidatus Paceibacterota bacterium]